MKKLLAAPSPKNTKVKDSKHHLEATATALELEVPGYDFGGTDEKTLDVMLVKVDGFELELAEKVAGASNKWSNTRVIKVDRAELGNATQVEVAYGYAQSNGDKVIMSEAVTITL